MGIYSFQYQYSKNLFFKTNYSFFEPSFIIDLNEVFDSMKTS